MTFTVRIELENEAFEYGGAEVARLLRSLADDIERILPGCGFDGLIRDVNGNTVGEFRAEGGE